MATARQGNELHVLVCLAQLEVKILGMLIGNDTIQPSMDQQDRDGEIAGTTQRRVLPQVIALARTVSVT